MWLKLITPSKGVMIRQQLMQLFGEAGQWASLVNASKLLAPHSSELHNSTQTEYKFMSLLKVEMLLSYLASWLGKYAGENLTHATKIEEYTARALAKMAHSSGKHLHEMAWTKDRLDCQKRWLIESMKLDFELLMISLTTQLSAMTSSIVALPPYDKEGGPTETRPAPSPYSDGNILIGNVNGSVTDDLYQ